MKDYLSWQASDLLRQRCLRLGIGVGLLLLLPFLGCGYRILGTTAALEQPRIVTIAVPPFTNRSLEVGLETIFAGDLLATLNRQAGIQAKPGDEEADYLLLGTIRKVEYTSVAYAAIDHSLVHRATVTVDLVLKKRQGQVLWQDRQIVKTDYVASPDYHLGEATRSQGLRQASARLAQRVRDKILLLF